MCRDDLTGWDVQPEELKAQFMTVRSPKSIAATSLSLTLA
jgi:hypothetical protein